MQIIDPTEPKYIRLNNASRVFGISEKHLTRWIREGKLTAYKPGRKMTLIRIADLEGLLESRQVQPAAACQLA